MAKKIKIKLVRSAINRKQNQKDTVEALGFSKMNQIIEKEATPQVVGMIEKVKHLVSVVD